MKKGANKTYTRRTEAIRQGVFRLFRTPVNVLTMLFLLVVPALAFAGFAGAEPQPSVKLTAEERAWLDHHPEKLTLFFNTEFPPIEFISESGEFVGMGADVVDRIEKRLGVAFVKSPCDDWNRHLAALESGECAIAPTIVRTVERERYAFFTTPYATVPVVIITARSSPGELSLDDLKGCRVGVVSGYATEKYVRDRALGRFEVVTVPNVSEGLRRVSFGQLDALVENLAVAAYTITQEGIPNLRVAGKTDYAFAWSIGVSRKYPLLYSSIQKTLEGIPERDLEDVRKRWIALETRPGMDPETAQLLKLAALFVVLLLLSLAGVTFFLKRRLAENVAGLRESEARFRELADLLPQTVYEADSQGMLTYANRHAFDLFGYREEDLKTGLNVLQMLVPEDRDRAARSIHSLLTEDAQETDRKYRAMRKDGLSFPVVIYASPIIHKGSAVGMRGIIVDMTENEKAEEEKERLQAQLTQAQKMESVGRLAGGVAHDFNNMLGIIIGNAEMALLKFDPSDPLSMNIQEILKASHRSAGLVRQLLAFARKQTVRPEVLDLNRTVERMLKMLGRLIGEDIDLSWRPGRDLWQAKIDPSQIDQILANLAVNARDAISGVGEMIIQTGNATLDEAYCAEHPGVTPGQYVLLAVSDNGMGMSKEVLDHLFEPFFTTKEVGKGTGLGLSSIYGAVKQNGGFIDVYSEPGKGTTFKIYLPRFETKAVEREVKDEPEALQRGTETVLMVEDEAAILKLGQAMLDSLGYRVLTANSPREAIRLAGDHSGTIHLLFTDVVMPEMNGRELAEQIRFVHPEIQCLYTSGYTANVIAHHGVLEAGMVFIHKPFAMKNLAAKVREALDKP